MGTDMCIEVIKFSYATGSRTDQSIPWQHIWPASVSIFAILKGHDTNIPDGKLVLRIVQGSTHLESIDIADYADQSKELRQRFWQAGKTLITEEVPISGITKDALFALKYKLPGGQARRLQFRMSSTSDCRSIVSVLERRGVEFQQQPPGTARPATANPSTKALQSQSLGSQTVSASYRPPHAPSQSSPFASQAMEAGSLSGKRQTEPEHSSTGAQYPTPASRIINRDLTLAPREAIADRPSTSHLYRPEASRSQPPQSQASKLPLERHRNETELIAAGRQVLKNYTSPPGTSSGSPGWSAGQYHSSSPTLNRARNETPSTEVWSGSHDVDPTASISVPDHSRADQYQPMPADNFCLPSPPNPAGQHGETGGAYKQPPLPNKESFGSRPNTASPLKQCISASIQDVSRPQTSVDLENATHFASSTSLTGSSASTFNHPGRGNESFHANKTTIGRALTNIMPRLNSLADAPHEVIDTFTDRPVSQDRRSLSPIKDVSNCDENAPPNRDPANQNSCVLSLGDYAAQSAQDRQAALEQFMIENLSNPDFTRLCEDVENCWSRFILGL